MDSQPVDPSQPQGVNIFYMVIGILGAVMFVISEILGFMNKYSSNCTSVVEFILKLFKLIREPTLEERLNQLNARRESQVDTNSEV
jgi:hypothetical protein